MFSVLSKDSRRGLCGTEREQLGENTIRSPVETLPTIAIPSRNDDPRTIVILSRNDRPKVTYILSKDGLEAHEGGGDVEGSVRRCRQFPPSQMPTMKTR